MVRVQAYGGALRTVPDALSCILGNFSWRTIAKKSLEKSPTAFPRYLQASIHIGVSLVMRGYVMLANVIYILSHALAEHEPPNVRTASSI